MVQVQAPLQRCSWGYTPPAQRPPFKGNGYIPLSSGLQFPASRGSIQTSQLHPPVGSRAPHPLGALKPVPEYNPGVAHTACSVLTQAVRIRDR